MRPTPITSLAEQPSISLQNHPLIERLKIDKGVDKKMILQDYNMLFVLRSICIKFPLFQAIKYILFYSKTIKELHIKNLGRKWKEIQKVQLIMKIS